MQNDTRRDTDRPFEPRECIGFLCQTLEDGVPQGFSLEWLMDRIEHRDWSRA